MATIEPAKLKVDELRSELQKRGIDSKGLKAELVKRLTEALASTTGASPSEAAPAAAEAEAESEAPKGKGKRKAPAKAAAKAAKEEVEEEEAPASKRAAITAALTEQAAAKKGGTAKVDSNVPGFGSYKVYTSGSVIFDVMLNQTNIGQNNNKYYVIQLLQNGSSYTTWNRWGRVGEVRQNQTTLRHFGGDLAGAVKDFEKKFKDKTANDWKNKDSFVVKSGKYTLLEMSYSDDEADVPKAVSTPSGKKAIVRPSKLAPSLQKFLKLIFDVDMFKEALQSYDIDLKKMPLGKMGKAQLAKGFEVLENLEKELNTPKPKSSELTRLTSEFYTKIPHDFGRRVPPVINTLEGLQQKYDLLEMMADVDKAQKLLEEDASSAAADEVDHPLDIHYRKLKNNIVPVDRGTDEWKWIEKYTTNTAGGWRTPTIIDIFRIDRSGEKERFTNYKHVTNRKMLWHGTKPAVMVAILSGGLRIMPHSGGRVGRGIYFASENAKSAGYTGTANEDGQQVGFMFLNEIALGNEHHITRDDPSLKKAPAGSECVIAKGRVEPDPKDDIKIKGEFGEIVVPQGKAIDMPGYKTSSFFNSEYLVYDEAQVYQRYVLKLKF